jgi:hypothetical protein
MFTYDEILAWSNLFFDANLLGHNIYISVYYGVLAIDWYASSKDKLFLVLSTLKTVI